MAAFHGFFTFHSNTKGAVAIEFALILPVLLLFAAGLIDYGQWFYLQQATQRTTANVANAVQRDQTQGFAQVNDGAGLGTVNMSINGNYICALASPTEPGAEGAAYGCGGNSWSLGNPTGNPATPYYIGVKTHLAYTPFIPLAPNWPPRDIFARSIVRINPTNTAALNGLPTCTAGQVLTSDSTRFICMTPPPPVSSASSSDTSQPVSSASSSDTSQPAYSAPSGDTSQPAYSAPSGDTAAAESPASSGDTAPAESAASSGDTAPVESSASSGDTAPAESPVSTTDPEYHDTGG